MDHFEEEGVAYHAHWKIEECYNAYWEFVPTVDHIYPVALGGEDSEENGATTSMLHNSIKSNWTLEQMQWELYEAGDYEEGYIINENCLKMSLCYHLRRKLAAILKENNLRIYTEKYFPGIQKKPDIIIVEMREDRINDVIEVKIGACLHET